MSSMKDKIQVAIFIQWGLAMGKATWHWYGGLAEEHVTVDSQRIKILCSLTIRLRINQCKQFREIRNTLSSSWSDWRLKLIGLIMFFCKILNKQFIRVYSSTVNLKNSNNSSCPRWPHFWLYFDSVLLTENSLEQNMFWMAMNNLFNTSFLKFLLKKT